MKNDRIKKVLKIKKMIIEDKIKEIMRNKNKRVLRGFEVSGEG